MPAVWAGILGRMCSRNYLDFYISSLRKSVLQQLRQCSHFFNRKIGQFGNLGDFHTVS